MKEVVDPCLECLLPDCNEEDPRCVFFAPIRERWRKDNCIRRKDPKYRAREYQSKKKQRKTDRGRLQGAAQQRRYRAKHPKTMAAINAKYYEANRVAILLKKKAAYKAKVKQ